MRTLVVGAAGFIGSHLVDHLLKYGHTVYSIDNLSMGKKENLPKFALKNFYQMDIRKKDWVNFAMRMAKPEIVFHLADFGGNKLSENCPSLILENNLNGSMNILSAAIKQKVRKFVFTSSIIGGEQFQVPETVYGFSKSYFENILKLLSFKYKLEYLIIRMPRVYGTRMALHDPYREGAEVIFRDILSGKRTVDDPALKKCLNIEDLIIDMTEAAFEDKIVNKVVTSLPMKFELSKIKQVLQWVKDNYHGEVKTLSFMELAN